MTPERWQRLKQLYDEVASLLPGQRQTFLAEVGAADSELRRELGLMLAVEEDTSFMNTPAPEQEARAAARARLGALAGRRLGYYQVVEALGAGAMGDVYLAQDLRLERRVALKVLPAEFTREPERLQRFIREAKAASALNHPNIITIYEIGTERPNSLDSSDGEAIRFIAAEYIEGVTLRRRLAEGRMSVRVALDVTLQIAAAIAAAHEAGIIHRDIKPENVMVRPDKIIKVVDFGLAKLTEAAPSFADLQASTMSGNDRDTRVVMGTPRYMSPEQARGERVDPRTDIFSLGVMLYEMIAGRAPFAGATTNETIAAILRDCPLSLAAQAPEAAGELERIVDKALRKERADRYPTAGDLLADLKELKQRLEIQEKLEEMGAILPSARATTGGSPESIMASPEKDLILVADFENKTGDDVFDGTLKQGLAIQLQQSPFLSLFPEERVLHTLRLMKRSPEERVTARIAREICVRHDLKALITGSITQIGSHYVITLEAIHGQTGESMEAVQVEARSKEQVLRALSKAATRLRAKLGESLSSILRFEKGLEETTTPKLEAFQAYALGYEQTLGGRLMDAIQLYRRAVELDPEFAYAWSMLSIHYAASGRHQLAAEYAEKGYALKDRVSDYEQLQLTFRYHFISTGDMDKALEAATLFKRTYPRTSTAPIDMLVSYNQIGRHDRAVAEGREALRLNPDFVPAYWYLGLALLRVNRFAEVKEIFNQALARKFDLTNIHSILYQIAFAEGDAAGMEQQLTWAKGRPEEYVALGWEAGTAAFAGQWRKSQELARRAIDLASRGATKELAARYATEQALWGAVLGDGRLVNADASKGLALERGRATLPRAALALALCGEANQVQPLIDELNQRYPEDTGINSIWLPTIRAALLLAGEPRRGISGNRAAEAIDHLQTTTSYEAAAEFWPQTLRGQACLKLGRGADAAMEFQKILAHRGQSPLSPLYPLAHLGLARAAALMGDVTKSRTAWEDFSAFWKEPDLDLPILIEARREFDLR